MTTGGGPTIYRLAAAGLAVVVFAAAFFVTRFLFRSYPFSMDEHAYVHQARVFASGRLTAAPAHPHEIFKDPYFVRHNGREFSKYPPMTSMLLAAGELLGAVDAVNPLLAAGALWLLFLCASRVVSPPAALAATALVATNPFFLGYASSYFAQPATLFFTAAAFWAVFDFDATRRKSRLVAAGFAIGALVVTRPLDALCAFLPCAWIVWPGPRRVGRALCFLIPIGAATLLFFLYNAAVSGRFGPSTYPLWDMEFEILDPESHGFVDNLRRVTMAYLNGVREHMWPLLKDEFFFYSGGFIMLLGAGGALSPVMRRWAPPLVLYMALTVGLYNFHHTTGWPQYGARYYYPLMVPLLLLMAGAVDSLLGALSARSARAAAAGLVVMTVGGAFWHLMLHCERLAGYKERFDFVFSARENIARVCPDDAVVVIDSGAGFAARPPEFVMPADLRRNAGWTSGRLYAYDEKEAGLMVSLLPGRPVCRYDFAAEREASWGNF